MQKLQYAIVITGGIGCGKSSVSRLFKSKEYEIIDADEISHQVLDLNQSEVTREFGKEILDSNQKINRSILGKIIFSDKHKKKKLEEILHPKIHQTILEKSYELEKHKKNYFLDIPLFFEVGGRERYAVQKVLLIYLPYNLQIQRIVNRDNITKEEAIKKIKSQMDLEKKVKMSDWVIENTKSMQDLQKEVEDFIQLYL